MLKPKNVSAHNQKVLPLGDCLAKTVKLADGTVAKGVSVATHCRIVGQVARELIRRQPQWLQDALYPQGSALVAAAHDLGKVSPHFQEKIHNAAGESPGIGNAELDTTLGGHAAVSQACLAKTAPRFIPQILGRHHGASPASVAAADAEIHGGSAWQQQRLDLLADLQQCFGCEWPVLENENQANALSGLVCVADWIGSGSLFDGVIPDGHPDTTPWQDCIGEAVDHAGFVGFTLRPGLSFEDVFSPFQPREAQRKLIQVANQQGVYILEAPMGMGKTEAALYATAYRALADGHATGIYFALPTQLTSEKIHDRMNAFLAKVLAEDCKFRSLLLHSSAWLRDTEIGEEGMPGHGWFNSSKRGLLAPFAVGTIDQALMGVMNVRHGFVRTFGLAGKVVILDEVHTYDCYTGTLLDKMVKTLRELHCTVIILSATLTAGRRAELLAQETGEAAYPLVSAAPAKGTISYLPVAQTDAATVFILVKHADAEALEEALRRAEQGEQVLWIENTVAESQDYFKVIAARAQASAENIDCGLLHSRFLRADRSVNEDRWVKAFDKEGYARRKERGRILVGTQVLEQSLDIDADFLITRMCPTDMLFQRIGRLWRHREADALRPVTARREAWILAPRLDDARTESGVWGKSGKVYPPYILFRSLDVWQEQSQVMLPQQIRPMLEATYAEQDESGFLGKCKAAVVENRTKLAALARIGLSTLGKTLPESKATTRYSEMDNCEVLLIKNRVSNDLGTTITLLSGRTMWLPTSARRDGIRQWRALAAELQQNVVLVPEYLAPVTAPHQIQWLKHFVYLGDRDESPFRVAMTGDDGTLYGIDHGNALQGYRLSYSPVVGYTAGKSSRSDALKDSW